MPRAQTTDKISRRFNLAALRERRGFTMIEILIAVSVIFILMGIVFVALKHSTGAAKSAQTRVSLSTLQTMFGELESTGGTRSQPAGWFWWQAGNLDGVDDGYIDGKHPNALNLAPSFWTAPYLIGGGIPDALSAPGIMGDDPSERGSLGGNLVGSPAVLNTQLAMSSLTAAPNNRTAFDKLPEDQKMVLPYVAGQVFTALNPAPAAAVVHQGFLNYGVPSIPGNVVYGRGNRVVLNGTVYTDIAPAVTTAAPPSPTEWRVETRNTPLLKDGWGHPIIYVPSGGIRVRLLNGKSAFDSTDAEQCFIIIAPPGKVGRATTAPKLPFVVSAGRPFFASAGPDGDFSKGDDNIYSFESQ